MLVAEGLKPRMDDEDATLVADVDVELAAADEKITVSAVVVLTRDTVIGATVKPDVGLGVGCVEIFCSKPDVVSGDILTSVECSAVCVTLRVDGDNGV